MFILTSNKKMESRWGFPFDEVGYVSRSIEVSHQMLRISTSS